MLNFFGWIRDGVRNAIVGGVQDALQDLDTAGTAQRQSAQTPLLLFDVSVEKKEVKKDRKSA